MTTGRIRSSGLTLVELMVVVAITVILASIAWPAFTGAMNKSRRSDAMSSLAQITQAQERWRANNPNYQATLAALPGAGSPVSSGNHYNLTLGNVNDSGYFALATARDTSPQARDTACRVMQVQMSVGNIIYSSLTSGGVLNVPPDPCWVR